MAEKFATVDDYVSSLPEDVQLIFEEVRRTIRSVVPGAEERISYQIPAIALNGKNVVHFAAWKHHISIYPLPAADEAFEQELAAYEGGKGTLKFPLNEPMPYDLMKRVVALLAKPRGGSGD